MNETPIKKEINVLSLFDGISCGQVAINRLNLPINNYYASEIDIDAINVTQYNYPKTIQLNDVYKWKLNFDKIINNNKIDLLIGGSPCQNFSIANINRNGIETDNLFDYYVDILHHYQPKWFLYENVSKMRKQDEAYITNKLNVAPITINSSDFSAQSRVRNYWTNIPVINTYIKNNKVVANIIDDEYIQTKYIHRSVIFDKIDNQFYCDKPNRIGYIDNLNRGNRIYSINGKAITLTRNSGGLGRCTGLYLVNNNIRRLTPLECERLQCLPDNYTSILKSDNKRYASIGNGWTVSVIEHLLSYLKNYYP